MNLIPAQVAYEQNQKLINDLKAERPIRSDIPTVQYRSPEEVTRVDLPRSLAQEIPTLSEGSRLHALWVAILLRILLAVPTFCPRSGWEFLKRVNKTTTQNLEQLGRYVGEVMTKLLKEGEVVVADSEWPERFWEFQDFRKMSPEATPQLIEIHQKKIIVFSDSTLRLGRDGHRDPNTPWIQRWNSHLGDLHYERFNIYGQEIVWQFQIQVGATTTDLIDKLKHDVKCHGGIANYKKRVIFMGSLNELAIGEREIRGNHCDPKNFRQHSPPVTTLNSLTSERSHG